MIEKVTGPLDEWMVNKSGTAYDENKHEKWQAFLSSKNMMHGNINKWEGKTIWENVSSEVRRESIVEKLPTLKVSDELFIDNFIGYYTS